MLCCKILQIFETCACTGKLPYGGKSICSIFLQKNYSPGSSAVQKWIRLCVQLENNVSGSVQPGHINKPPLFWGERSKTNSVDQFSVSVNT